MIVCIPTFAAADAKDELKKFDGTWKVVRAEKEGKVLPDDKAKAIQVTIKDGKITIKDGNDVDVATLKIDPSKSPATIDFIPADDDKLRAPGIYAFEGETLKICWSSVRSERPKEFASKMETETNLFILMREK